MARLTGEWSDVHLISSQSWPSVIGNADASRSADGSCRSATCRDDQIRSCTSFAIGSNGRSRHHQEIARSHRASAIELPISTTLFSPSSILPKMESFWFTAADKTKLQGFIIRPPGFDAAKKYPVKFLIHGGPQGAWGDSWSYRWNAELFAANGYVVVMINPRGSTGYGQAIVDGVNGDWGGKPFTDLMTGLDYAEQHYPLHRQDARVRAGRELRRVHGQLGAGPYGPLQVHRVARRHVQCGVGLWIDGRRLVQRSGSSKLQTPKGASVGLLRQAGQRESLPQVVADALRPKTSRRRRWWCMGSSITGSM